MLPVIVNRHAPLLVMIRDEMRLGPNPPATSLTVGNQTSRFWHQSNHRLRTQPPSTSGEQEYTISVSCDRKSVHAWETAGARSRRLLKMFVQQGRRRVETGGVPLGYVEDYDEPRTKLAGIFSSLLGHKFSQQLRALSPCSMPAVCVDVSRLADIDEGTPPDSRTVFGMG